MTEPKENIGAICIGCSEDRKAKTQKDIENKLRELSGKIFWVKKAFSEPDNDMIEHMLVKVNEIKFKNNQVSGVLDNDPHVIKRLKCGDPITLHFSEIEDVIL